MSFNGTSTPIKPVGKARWQIPMRYSEEKHAMEYYFTPELEERFKKYFRKNSNRRVMAAFGISFSSMQKYKRIFGLEKDMKAIRKQLADDIKKICEENGYYDSLRGKQPSQECLDGYKRLLESGFNPLRSLKEKNPRRYKKVIQTRREKRLKLEQSEQLRVKYGMPQATNLHRPEFKYTHAQVSYRRNMKARGYILGDYSEKFGERYVIYYDDNTDRRPVAERHAEKYGMQIKPLCD